MSADDQRSLALLVVGFVLLAGIPALLWQPQPAAVGTRPAPAAATPATLPASLLVPAHAATPSAAPPSAPPTSAPAEGRSTGSAPAVSTRSARLADLDAPGPRVEPVAVRLPDLGVEAPVDDVGVEPGGEMEIPDDVGTVGWYRHGAAPGEEGSAVLAGHVDGRTQGPGALFRLRELDPGATVAVDMEDGTTRAFTVVARERVPKDDAPLDELFRTSGDPMLVLITCGGAFDAANGRYEDNIVVYAKQLD